MVRFLRLSTALVIATAAWLHQPSATISCGPYYDSGAWHITCFDPRVLPDSLFGQFVLSIGGAAGMTSAGDFPEIADTARRYDRNVHDWSNHLDGRVPLAEIHAFVYSDSLESLQRLMRVMRDEEPMFPWDDSSDGRMAHDILERGDMEMLRYLIFAKECEPYGVPPADEWYEAQNDSVPEIPELMERGLAEAKECRDERLRLRYGYQLVRLAQRAKEHQRAIGLYDSLVAPNRSDLGVRYFAMLGRAGALAKLGREAEALYLRSIVFDRCPERAWPALIGFSIPSDTTWDSTYAMAASDHERYVLWMMRGLREYSLDTRPMEMMTKLEPREPRLDVMLLREVREVERKLFSEQVTRPARRAGETIGHGTAVVRLDGWSWAEDWRDPEDDDGYPARLARFAERSADARLVPNRALWYAVAGYMRIIAGDFADAAQDLDSAGRYLTEGGRLQNQIQALRLLSHARNDQYLSTDIASSYASVLTWLDTTRKAGYEEMGNSPTIMLLGQKYLAQGDVPRAAAAFHRGGNTTATAALLDMYATDAELLTLQQLLEQRRSLAIDTFLFDRFPFSAPQILDLRATRMMRRGEFASAVGLWDELYSRPRTPTSVSDTVSPETIEYNGRFTAVIDTTLPTERSADYRPVEREMTRSAFARQMVAFEKLAVRSRRDGIRYNHAMATALSSQPYWGYSSQLWQGGLVFSFRYFARAVEYPFNDPVVAQRMAGAQVTFLREYGSNEIAWRYLDRVRQATDNPELAATVAFAMDEALKNPLTSLHTNPERQDRTGYNLLRTTYRKTKFARRVLTSCGTYEYFAGSR